MSAPRIHRVAGGTKRARQLMARHGTIERGPGLTSEQMEWNARVDAERAMKKAAKLGVELKPCCANEKRNVNGGCDNCGDPCL